MTRPARKPAAAPVRLRNDACPDQTALERIGAALERQAEAVEAVTAQLKSIAPAMRAGRIWLVRFERFCRFLRRWLPRLFWLLPVAWAVVGRGGSEVADALMRAALAYLEMQTGG